MRQFSLPLLWCFSIVPVCVLPCVESFLCDVLCVPIPSVRYFCESHLCEQTGHGRSCCRRRLYIESSTASWDHWTNDSFDSSVVPKNRQYSNLILVLVQYRYVPCFYWLDSWFCAFPPGLECSILFRRRNKARINQSINQSINLCVSIMDNLSSCHQNIIVTAQTWPLSSSPPPLTTMMLVS